MNFVTFDIYKLENNQKVFLKKYNYSLDKTILELKNEIIKDFYQNQFNYINFMNITEKVYKDYGLLFFDKGLISAINDNYPLNKFSIPNRVFSFLIEPIQLETKKRELNNENKPKFKSRRYELKNSNYHSNDKNYVFNEDDFPPLC